MAVLLGGSISWMACGGSGGGTFVDGSTGDGSHVDGSLGDGSGDAHLDGAGRDGAFDGTSMDVADASLGDGASNDGAEDGATGGDVEDVVVTDTALTDVVAGDGAACDGGGTTSCGVGECRRTVQACVGGHMTTCTPGTPSPEICDGLDNDCNGLVDDGLGSTTCGMGACQMTVNNCAGGTPQTCTPGAPSPEICDGVDNNCNGTIDEGLGSTTCGIGACQVMVNNCVGGHPMACTPGTPTPEVCNGVDDNCDGVIDNGLGSSMCGVGACMRTQPNCVAGMPHTCAPGVPTTEICDGIDNNCNGSVDEALGSTTCGVGACQRTTPNCVAGTTQTCVSGTPTPEVCNGVDDDCDGVVDNGDPGGGGVPCNTGLFGVCATGARHCVSGTVTCVPTIAAMPEVCDGIDNNCNGLVDEGNPGGGAVCNTGMQGACAAGTVTCTGGSLQCLRSSGPTAEVCDGIDNDCNGIIDDGLGSTTCGVGYCQSTVQNCVGGHTQPCTPGAPRAEVCNGVDDNCNGVVDDGTAAMLCPDPANVSTTACVAGNCSINMCATNTYDVDATYADGCECVDDTNAQACGSSTPVTGVTVGGAAVSVSGKVVPAIATADTGDWFQVNFAPNWAAVGTGGFNPLQHGTGTPHIAFTRNDGNVFRFELRSMCASASLSGACNGAGDTASASGLVNYDYTDNQRADGNYSARNFPWVQAATYPATAAVVYVRVYRIDGGLSCGNYTLSFSQ